MIHKVIDKFEKECEKNPDDMTVRVICDHIVERLQSATEETLKNILDNNLSIEAAIERMRDVASKKKTGNYAVLSDKEGFAIVDNYFGIDTTPLANQKTVSLFDLV